MKSKGVYLITEGEVSYSSAAEPTTRQDTHSCKTSEQLQPACAEESLCWAERPALCTR